MEKLFYSPYNFLFLLKSGVKVLYNSVTNKVYQLTDELYEVLLLIKKDEDVISLLDMDKKSDLVKKQVLVTKEYSTNVYNKLLKNYVTKNNSSVLNLTVIPTFLCNFKCDYCFEREKNNIYMSADIIDMLINFIASFSKVEGLSISWFGGEPLLSLNIIKQILDKIKDNISIPLLNQSIISNGYNINEEVCNFFNQYKINKIQITFDGLPEAHDKIRVLKNGHGTFKKILSNIKLLCDKCPEMQIKLRINVSQYNKHEYLHLKEYLYQELGRERITIYPGFIFCYNKSNTCLVRPSLTVEEKKSFLIQSKEIDLPGLCRKECTATQLYSYVIGPRGELYKCWEDVNIPSKIIGHLNGKKDNLDLMHTFMFMSCFQNSQCMNCSVLPICTGGCCRKRIINNFEGGDFELCTLYKDTEFLKACIERYYEKSVIESHERKQLYSD